jgi:hypothetical protein
LISRPETGTWLFTLCLAQAGLSLFYLERERSRLFHVFRNILGLLKDLFHIIEVIFLAFVFFDLINSLSLGIIVLLILLIAAFFFHNISKAVAWGIVGFLIIPGGVLLKLVMAVLFGGVRYLIGHGFRFFKK